MKTHQEKMAELFSGFREPLEKVITDVASKGVILEIEPIYGGRRTAEQQRKIVGNGYSKTLHSYHLTGEAADLYQRIDGKLVWPSRRAQLLIGSAAWARGLGWGGMFGLRLRHRKALKDAILALRDAKWPPEHALYSIKVGWDAVHVQSQQNWG